MSKFDRTELDFTDQLELYTAKMRMESDPMWRVGVQAYQQQLKSDAVRLAIADLEEARWRFSQVLSPFLPETAKRPPVALSEAPAAHQEQPYYDDDPLPQMFNGARGS